MAIRRPFTRRRPTPISGPRASAPSRALRKASGAAVTRKEITKAGRGSAGLKRLSVNLARGRRVGRNTSPGTRRRMRAARRTR